MYTVISMFIGVFLSSFSATLLHAISNNHLLKFPFSNSIVAKHIPILFFFSLCLTLGSAIRIAYVLYTKRKAYKYRF